jgi:glutamate synthase (NADPH/NADH) large chain
MSSEPWAPASAHEIARRYGDAGLPDDTIVIHAPGSAGQSFFAFGAPGITVTVKGDANDYFGKGLSGAMLAIRPPDGAAFSAEENIIIGNVALYGATAGRAYIRGRAGERFGVRNSGAVGRGGRGRRPRMRVHDRRPLWWCWDPPAAISPPA